MRNKYGYKQLQLCKSTERICRGNTGKRYMDLMELHILELRKLPAQDKNEGGIIRWMRF